MLFDGREILQERNVVTRFQILTLDGGGVRGSFALGVIAELEGALGHSITECFDMLAGTSTGAIAAAGLSLGLSGEDLIRFYREHIERIFQPREPYRAKGWTRPIFPLVQWTFRRRTGSKFEDLLRAKYCPHALEQAFSNVFAERTLGDIHSHRLVVPVVDLTLGQTRVFRTPHLPRGVSDAGERLIDVLMAATAAPTYFPHRVLPDGHAYNDGGLWAVSPSILALAEALRIRQLCVGDHCAPPFDISDIHLLNLGTGRYTYSLTPPGEDAGSLYWSNHVADVMSISQMQGIQEPLFFLLADRYRTINFDLPDASWGLDSVEHVEEMIALGRRFAREQLSGLGEEFLAHRAPPYEAMAEDPVM